MISEIETVLLQNSHSVYGECIPHYIEDINQVSLKTVEALLDCSIETKIKDAIKEFLPIESQKILDELMHEDQTPIRRLPTTKVTHMNDSILTDNLQERLNKLSHESRTMLMQEISHLHTFNVCEVVNQIGVVTKERRREKQHIQI